MGTPRVALAVVAVLAGCARHGTGALVDSPPTHDGVPGVAWFDARPFAHVRYVAALGKADFARSLTSRMPAEHGAFLCIHDPRAGTCPADVGAALDNAQGPGFLVVDDPPDDGWLGLHEPDPRASIRVLTLDEVRAQLVPVESAADAGLVVYARMLEYGDFVVSPAYIQVRPDGDAFDVYALTREYACSREGCCMPGATRTERDVEIVLRVRSDGNFEIRSRRLLASATSPDVCHPL